MRTEEWKNYFEKNSKDWVDGAYQKNDYVYPVGYHRLRILDKVLSNYELKGKKVLDIGCGGGDASFLIASMGATVDAVDMTESMLAIAREKKADLPDEVQARISFHKCEFHNIPKLLDGEKYDFIIAFGLIGYLENDNVFFKTVAELCHNNTVLVFSCRNRLFNMTSITNNTIAEIENGTAVELIKEIDTYYHKDISQDNMYNFIDNVKKVAGELKIINQVQKAEDKDQSMENLPGTGKQQPRQSTPASVSKEAKQQGFVPKKFLGVHPHLLLPRLNKKLPPKVFNLLSDTLCAFEDEPISLIYSSVFIAEMEYIKDI